MSEQKHQESNTESKHVELSEQYYKSRKQLMLYSGLFFVYEFIGIKVPAKPLPNSEIELLSPQAVPLVLLILVIYFLYRSFLGWRLSSKAVREMKVSKWDFYPSIVVASITILLFVYQSITKIQIADFITNVETNVFMTLGLVMINLIFISSAFILYAYSSNNDVKPKIKVYIPFILIFTILIIMNIYSFLAGSIDPIIFLLIMFLGILFLLWVTERYLLN